MSDNFHYQYIVRLADNTLILGQRLSEWCGHGPVLEEDLALTNIALDLIGQARLLLAHVGALEGRQRDEDQLAFLRDQHEFRNVALVELPNGDFAHTMVRNLLFGAFQVELWQALHGSADAQLQAVAQKSLKEARYHLQHAGDWVVRLGDGTEESHGRAQEALDSLWRYAAELFAPDPMEQQAAAAGIGPEWSSLEPAWRARVEPVLEEATLRIPPPTGFRSTGKTGVHTEHLGHLLAEMQWMQRAYPGMKW
jgi:ring-1,2-phenylacetyl-CoA epoxidase subunit PaaC